MYRIVIITDPDTAAGYRLAGVSVLEASTPEETGIILRTLLEDDDVGIIGIREDLLSCIDTAISGRLERRYHPIIVPIPVPRKKTMSGYIEGLLRRSIGFNVVVRS